MKVIWAWKSKTSFPLLRSLPLFTAALLQIAAFGIAGLFVSRVTQSDTEALVRSQYCGTWPAVYLLDEADPENRTAVQRQSAYNINARRQITESLQYAQSCYWDPAGCSDYIVPALLTEDDVDMNATCPFEEELCLLNEAVRVDTGLMDSATLLGINARFRDRVWYRRTSTCALLNSRDFSSSQVIFNGPNEPFDLQTYFFYGPSSDSNVTQTFSNYTYDGNYQFWYDLE